MEGKGKKGVRKGKEKGKSEFGIDRSMEWKKAEILSNG